MQATMRRRQALVWVLPSPHRGAFGEETLEKPVNWYENVMWEQNGTGIAMVKFFPNVDVPSEQFVEIVSIGC
jgi:hypothetical protein